MTAPRERRSLLLVGGGERVDLGYSCVPQVSQAQFSLFHLMFLLDEGLYKLTEIYILFLLFLSVSVSCNKYMVSE